VPKPKKRVERTMSQTSRQTGLGTKRGARRTDAGGAIPSGNVSNPVPTIRAKVQAEGMKPPKSQVRVYLDGAEQRRFYYGRATGNLSYRPTGMLSSGTHTIEIVISAEQGRSTARKSWTFTVS
jgi:hypothetical protein